MARPDGVVDLRSDTVTTPTPAMRRAMADAEVGDDAYGEDPTVTRLEALAADRLGTAAALYVTSGTMANQLGLRVLSRPGTEVLCAERAHVYRYEHAATAGNSAVQLRPVPDPDGRIDPSAIDRAVADAGEHLPPLSAGGDREPAHAGERPPWSGGRGRRGRRRGARPPPAGPRRRRQDLERRRRDRRQPPRAVARRWTP